MGSHCLEGRVGGADVGGVVDDAAVAVVAGGAAGGVVECGVDYGVEGYGGYVGGYDSPPVAVAQSRPYPSACLQRRRRAFVLQGRCVDVGDEGGAGGVAGHGAVPGGGAAGLDGGVLDVKLRLPSWQGPREYPSPLQPRPYSG